MWLQKLLATNSDTDIFRKHCLLFEKQLQVDVMLTIIRFKISLNMPSSRRLNCRAQSVDKITATTILLTK